MFPLVALLAILAVGLAMFVAAVQVYFRDLANFLPYVLRVWLYISPVLYYAARGAAAATSGCSTSTRSRQLLTAWSDVLNPGSAPPAGDSLLVAALGVRRCFVAGALFFMSREREFAVRL